CYDATNASAYRGSASITLSGFACQNWDANTPNIHTFHSYRNPSLAELGHHNFCRAPLGDTMPWCFTTNPAYRWEYCDVDPCGDQPTTAVMSTTMQPTPVPTTASTSLSTNVPSTVSTTVQSTVPSTVPSTGSLPWIVALRRYPSFSFSCGGSVIDKNWILTAAHCVRNIPGNYRAILGNYLNYEIDDEEKVVGFSRFFIHEEYDSTLLINDIALLKLSEPLVFNDFIKPVCLPDYNPGVPYVDGEAVLISGWGTLKSGSLPNILQQAYVNIVSLTECSRRYGQQFSSDVMCAGVQQGGIDTCQGDSGGPLLDPNGNVQLGVVSWGRGCARAQYPGIYTSVSYFRNWIDNIRNNN
uniref:Peptidase S1 domain-containing protein n=1 Tax=Ciona savignyi TaxID=51511 RepID=H2Y5M0_CIOSA